MPANTKKIVTKEVLEIYDKYHGDFGLLDEWWASDKDKERISDEHALVLGQYVDELHFLNVKNLSEELRRKTLIKIKELESKIDQEVIDTIKQRMQTNKLA